LRFERLSIALLDNRRLVDIQVPEYLFLATWPTDAQLLDALGRTEARMDIHAALTALARAANNLTNLGHLITVDPCCNPYSGPYGRAVRYCAYKLEVDPPRWGAEVLIQSIATVIGTHQLTT